MTKDDYIIYNDEVAAMAKPHMWAWWCEWIAALEVEYADIAGQLFRLRLQKIGRPRAVSPHQWRAWKESGGVSLEDDGYVRLELPIMMMQRDKAIRIAEKMLKLTSAKRGPMLYLFLLLKLRCAATVDGIYYHSVADLATECGTTKARIVERLKWLMEEGLLERVGKYSFNNELARPYAYRIAPGF